jgi:hypothetical protein
MPLKTFPVMISRFIYSIFNPSHRPYNLSFILSAFISALVPSLLITYFLSSWDMIDLFFIIYLNKYIHKIKKFCGKNIFFRF